MKTVSDEYITQEEADERKPVDLYKMWLADESEFWYYTSGDATITYSGIDYVPATLERNGVSYDQKLDVTTMDIQAAYVNNPIIEYITQNPIGGVWISIQRVFRDQYPVEASVIFVGQIKKVSFQGAAAKIQCVGFEHFLQMPVPTWRYQITCNLKLYDDKCKIVKNSYKLTTSGTLDSTGTIFTSSAFALEDDGYFNGGTIEFGSDTRSITAHTGSNITLIYKMTELEDNNTVNVYPGCDLRIETCRDTYNNVINFMGTPFIPIDNPALRT